MLGGPLPKYPTSALGLSGQASPVPASSFHIPEQVLATALQGMKIMLCWREKGRGVSKEWREEMETGVSPPLQSYADHCSTNPASQVI